MTTMNTLLTLLTAQGLMGAFDTLYHHELRAKLPQQPSAAKELGIHGVRAMLYAVVFAGLAGWVWGGAWAWVFGGIVWVEIMLTLWDFLTEDDSRKLPWSERVLHTVLAINGGAVCCLLTYELIDWAALPSQLVWVNHGWFTPVLLLFALGVFASGVRDSIASRRMAQLAARAPVALDFGPHTRFLIAGATGFIGQTLVKSLLTQGHSVAAWVRDPIAATHQLSGAVQLVTALEQLGHSPFDVVINLAGESVAGARWTARRKTALMNSRVHTTQALQRWMASLSPANRPQRVLTASAIGYYGNQTLGDTRSFIEQDVPTATQTPADFGSQLCQAAEQAAAGYDALGVSQVCLRLGVVFGHKGALPSMLLPFRLFAGGRIGDGRQTISWIHLHDALRAMAHIARQANSKGSVASITAYNDAYNQAYNLTAPESISNQTFATTAGRVLGRPSGLPAPAWVFQLMFGDMSSLFTQGIRVLPARLVAEGFVFEYPTLNRALQQLEA